LFEYRRFYKNIFFINEVFALFARLPRCIYRPFWFKCYFYSFIVLFISINSKCVDSLHIIFPSSYIAFVQFRSVYTYITVKILYCTMRAEWVKILLFRISTKQVDYTTVVNAESQITGVIGEYRRFGNHVGIGTYL